MKYPLTNDEWKWVFLAVLMVTIVALGFGLILTRLTGNEMFLPLSGFLWLIFLWFKLIEPIIRRI